MEVFDVSLGAAYAVLYSVLGFFTFLAIGSGGYLGKCIPDSVLCCFRLNGLSKGFLTTDYFLSARNGAGAWSLALSFFASGMGAWVLYGTTEMGATPQLSWLGVIGYSSASAMPAILICWLGPKVRSMSMEAFSTTDFGRKRYGRVMQVVIACVSGFYMFIFLVAELTSISSIFGLLTNNMSTGFGVSVSVSVGLITILYTTIAGVPASIVTDKFQGIMMAFLVTMLTIVVPTKQPTSLTRDEFALASNWTTDGLMAAVTLFIAIACAELFNQGNWQRVWAAESVPAMRKGFALGSVMVFLLMMFFGVMGMIAYAQDPEAYDSGEKLAYLAFFDLLLPLNEFWYIVTLILVTALCASTVDTLQNALVCIFSRDLIKLGYNPKWIVRGMMLATNAPAIYLASKKFDVISLFLVADLVCATSVFPVFLGLQTNDKGIFKAPTELGAALGCLSGLVAVLVIGIINNSEGGIFQYFWLDNGAICALCGSQTMITFIVTPLVSLVATYLFSSLDNSIRRERARQPLIHVAFDGDDETNVSGKDENCDDFDENGKENELSDEIDGESSGVKKDTSEFEEERVDV